jgi:hypothetical protein
LLREDKAGLVDAFLQDLAGLVLAVVHHLVLVDRRIQLTRGVVDADLAEQAFHAEGARFVDEDGHHARAQFLVAQQLREEAHVGLGRRDLAAWGRGLQHHLEGLDRGHGELLVGSCAPSRQVAAQRLAALVQVFHLRRVVGRLVERDLGQVRVRDRDIETVAEVANVLIGQLLGLVRRILAFARLAHAPALDGLHQQHGGLGLVVHGTVERGIDLGRIVAAAAQRPDVGVGHLAHHFQRARVASEEMLAHEGAVIGLEGLVVAVQRVHHDLAQRTLLVARQQRIPVAAPDQLDHVPSRASEFALELLDDLAVAAYRAVQPLQIAVDDEDQVVQPLARGQADGTQTLGLVHLAVTAEDPDLALAGVGDAAGVQVFQEARLVDRHQGAQAHRHGGELPEIRHQLRMRIARQALAIHFLAEVEQLLFGEPALHEGAGIDAGCAVALDVQAVAAVIGAGRMPEVIEARREQMGQRREGADVAAQVAAVRRVQAVGLDHQSHRIPAHIGAQTPFELEVAGAARLLVRLDRIHVAGIGRERHVHAVLPSLLEQVCLRRQSPHPAPLAIRGFPGHRHLRA